MFESPCLFEPTFLIREIYIVPIDDKPSFWRKSEIGLRSPTWLRLGIKLAGYGILGTPFVPSHFYEAAFLLNRK